MKPRGASPAPPLLRASPIAILGVPFDPVTLEEAVELVAAMVRARHPRYGVTANVDFVVQARTDPELRQILFDGHLVLCDGMPLVWASKLLGNPLPERVAGSDLAPRLLAEAERREWRVFFLGGTPESVERAADRTLTRHPRVRLVGAYSPPFQPLFDMNHAEICARVAGAQPDLLFVAFGCPKQEKWINMHYRHLGVPFSIGVGATIDFLAGTQVRAPRWMQRSGTEWIHRLVHDPRRLARRYGKGFVVFTQAILAQARQLRAAPRPRTRRAAQIVASPPASSPTPPPHRPGTMRVLTAPDRLDAAAARRLVDGWVAAIELEHIAVDLDSTSFVDSTGLGLLSRLQKTATEKGHQLVLARAKPQLVRALEMMRLERCFQLQAELPTEPLPETQVLAPAGPSPQPTARGLKLVWPGSVTATALSGLAETAIAALDSLAPRACLQVDLSQVTFIDSSGLSLMVGLKKRAWQRDLEVTYSNPTPETRHVLRLTQLEDFLLSPRRPPPGNLPAAPSRPGPASP